MEGLRHTLLVPAASTVFMTLGCIHAMKEMIKPRYGVKDDNGKPLLPHPYKPWVEVPDKNKKDADDAYRAFKMYENVKEWTVLALPLMWTSSIFVGSLPYMNDDQNRVDIVMSITSIVWMYGQSKYITGYMKSPEDRLLGFKIRTRTTLVWLGISIVSLGYTALQRFGVVN